VGVAFAGTGTRNREVGEAAGNVAAGFPEGAAQPAIKKMVSTIVRRVRLITFLRPGVAI